MRGEGKRSGCTDPLTRADLSAACVIARTPKPYTREWPSFLQSGEAEPKQKPTNGAHEDSDAYLKPATGRGGKTERASSNELNLSKV